MLLNGTSVNGYPINHQDCSETNVLYQFNETVGRLHNNGCGSGLKKAQFQSNFIWAHYFEAQTISNGSIEMEIKLKDALTTSHTMVVWTVSESSFSIDKFHTVEQINN